MHIQYFIVGALVAIVVIVQVVYFFRNQSLIGQLSSLFPNDNKLSFSSEENTIVSQHTSENFKDTLYDINRYLKENKGQAADYQIIKEIVERDSLRIEEEVDTMLAIPLYLGLMATILGAAIGIVSFAWLDLSNLLSGESLSTEGIKTLLSDIGIAMLASFFGVLFTAMSTSSFKAARSNMLKQKHRFLSWIQATVMPNMVGDLASALAKMTQDLNNFNNTFAVNTRELQSTLSMVSGNYENQVKLLEAIEKIKIAKIASANIEVYDKLKDCTDELNTLSIHLGKSNEYVSKVVELNDRLGAIEERTRLSEELGDYFKHENEAIQERQGMMNSYVNNFDSKMRETFETLSESVEYSVSKLTDAFQRQVSTIESSIEDQQNSLARSLDDQSAVINNKIDQINDPFGGLKDVFKESLDNIKEIFQDQNKAVEQMLANQKEMLESQLSSQRDSFSKQLNQVPQQLNGLAGVIEKLNSTLAKQQESQNEEQETEQVSFLVKLFEKVNRCIVPVGVIGSFLLLLAILLVQLFDFKF